VDLPGSPDGDRLRETEAGGLPEGFVIDHRKTVYYGLCGKCAAGS
jgi:hypothetical protein